MRLRQRQKSRAEQLLHQHHVIELLPRERHRGGEPPAIDRGYGGQPQLRGTLTVDRATADVVRWEPFDQQSTGRQLRSFLRFAHTGEYFGLVGQTIAGLASAGAVVLVWTGISLALRRFGAWRSRRARPAAARVPESNAA